VNTAAETAAGRPPGPPTVITYRREPTRDRTAFPQVSAPFPVEAMPGQASIQDAPQPVEYTQWWNVGRDAQHAWPVRWLYQAVAIPEWLSVMGWPFSGVGHTKPGSLVTAPSQRAQYRGTWLSQAGRANIEAPAQTNLGSQATLYAPISGDVNNMKLG
jgi:hypothetical protein